MLNFCLELGGPCTRGPLDFANPAHPILTPLSSTAQNVSAAVCRDEEQSRETVAVDIDEDEHEDEDEERPRETVAVDIDENEHEDEDEDEDYICFITSSFYDDNTSAFIFGYQYVACWWLFSDR